MRLQILVVGCKSRAKLVGKDADASFLENKINEMVDVLYGVKD